MVIDKAGILAILRSSEKDVLAHSGEDSILITTRYNDFKPDIQIGNDSIDLRIDDNGYILSNDYNFINTLSEESFEPYFEQVSLKHDKGYDLKPGDVLFIGTLERIHLAGDLIGRVTGRSVFSRFGLSVHCTQDKFSSGINSIAALQIKNNSNSVLKIFPYQKLAQLIIEKTSHNQTPYTGTFSMEETYTLPIVKPSDRLQYDERTKSNILRQKSRKKSVLKRGKKSEKFYTLLQSIIGIVVSGAAAFAGFFDDLDIKIIFLVIIFILYLITSIGFYFIADEREGNNEKRF